MANIQQKIEFGNSVDKKLTLPHTVHIIYKPSDPLTERKLHLLALVNYLNWKHENKAFNIRLK